MHPHTNQVPLGEITRRCPRTPTVKQLEVQDTPDSVRPKAFASVEEHVRAKTEEYMRRMTTEFAARRDARNRAFTKDIIDEIPEDHIRSSGA